MKPKLETSKMCLIDLLTPNNAANAPFGTYSITLHLSKVYDGVIDIDIDIAIDIVIDIGQTLTLTLRLDAYIDIVIDIDTGQWLRENIDIGIDIEVGKSLTLN